MNAKERESSLGTIRGDQIAVVWGPFLNEVGLVHGALNILRHMNAGRYQEHHDDRVIRRLEDAIKTLRKKKRKRLGKGKKGAAPCPPDFWGVANRAFSAKDRVEFNKWKLAMYLASERATDAVISGSCSERSYAQLAAKVRDLHRLVCQIPALLK